jgi:signal transduction histidine kinase
MVDTADASIHVDLPPDATVSGDGQRLKRLFENLFRNSVEHGSTVAHSQAHEDSVAHGSTGSRPEADDAAGRSSVGSQAVGESDDAVEHGPAGDRNASRSDDAIGDGGRLVTVRVSTTEDGFVIEDDGSGVDPELREEVFEPGVSTAAAGTGLGLAIVGEIVEAHGWTITLDESVPAGTRFVVRVSNDERIGSGASD